MKYNEFTRISDIIESVQTDWESFKQDIISQKQKNWLSSYQSRQDLAELINRQLHCNWGTLYPFISTLLIFEKLSSIERDSSNDFISSFKAMYHREIEEEFTSFKLRNSDVDRMFGIRGETSRPIVGFILASDCDSEYSVYILYEGINTFGCGTHPDDPSFQMLVTSERLLQNRHFQVNASKLTGLYFKTLNGGPFKYESDYSFKEGNVDYRSHLILGSLHIRFIQNFN